MTDPTNNPTDNSATPSSAGTGDVFVAGAEARGKARQLRAFAFVAWIIAMAGQAFAIFRLISDETLVYLIIAIVVILALAVTGSILWKKANRLDPASEKDKARFFFQNQLGAIMGVLAFLPMVILILMNKDVNGKTKGIAGAIAVVAMLVAGVSGVDFDPPSVEKYTEQIQQQTQTLKTLNFDEDNVFWTTRAGSRYHIFPQCQHIRGRDSIANGTVEKAWEANGISELCRTCQARAMKDRNITEEELLADHADHEHEI